MHASIQLYEPNSSRRIGPQTGRVPAEAFDVVSVHSRSLTVGWGMRSTSVHVLEWHCVQTTNGRKYILV